MTHPHCDDKLREALDRLAYAFWMTAPFTIRNTALGRWLLPFAGRHEARATLRKLKGEG